MFVTNKTFTAVVSEIADETRMLWDYVHKAEARADVQRATTRRLEEELRKRDSVLAENTRRINALMAFVGVTEHKVPATPETTIYTQEQT